MRIPFKSLWRRENEAEVPCPDGKGPSVSEVAGSSASLRTGLLTAHPITLPIAAEPAQGAYDQALQGLEAQPGESLALSVQVPFCAAHCLFCPRQIHAAQPSEVIDRYVQALALEAEMLARRTGRDRDVLQLHLGGGSANDLSEVQLVRLVDALSSAWRLPADAEMSVECDPRRTSRRQLELLRALGFRQLRFGVADLDGAVQRAIGRCHSQALIEDVCVAARAASFERIQVELWVGLPLQSVASWQSTLARVIALAPDRVALERYVHQPERAPGQHAIDRLQLPDDATCADLQVLSSTALQAAGYVPIGTRLFVLDDEELARAQAEGRLRQSLIGFTATAAAPLLGLGAGAVSKIADSLYQNSVRLTDWQAAVLSGRLPVAGARRVSMPGLG